MKYIGSFFKANSLSKEEIASQLLFLSKESVNHIVLESRCGISTNYKNLKENFKKEEISFFKNNTPLICIYKKQSLIFILLSIQKLGMIPPLKKIFQFHLMH